jgi:hypothetical protein
MDVIGDVTGLDSVTCSGVCEVGHYCEPGAVSATNAPCPAGSYGASTGEHNLLDVFHALQCLPHSHIRSVHHVTLVRFSLFASGLGTSECSGPCPAGYFCPTGSNDPTARPCGT